jgi:hypothetical protein
VDWRTIGEEANSRTVFIVYTLADYMDDLQLRENLLARCPLVRRFSGTLGGGDINICERRSTQDVQRR